MGNPSGIYRVQTIPERKPADLVIDGERALPEFDYQGHSSSIQWAIKKREKPNTVAIDSCETEGLVWDLPESSDSSSSWHPSLWQQRTRGKSERYISSTNHTRKKTCRPCYRRRARATGVWLSGTFIEHPVGDKETGEAEHSGDWQLRDRGSCLGLTWKFGLLYFTKRYRFEWRGWRRWRRSNSQSSNWVHESVSLNQYVASCLSGINDFSQIDFYFFRF